MFRHLVGHADAACFTGVGGTEGDRSLSSCAIRQPAPRSPKDAAGPVQNSIPREILVWKSASTGSAPRDRRTGPVAYSNALIRRSRSARAWPNRRPTKAVLAHAEVGIQVAAETLRHVGGARTDAPAMGSGSAISPSRTRTSPTWIRLAPAFWNQFINSSASATARPSACGPDRAPPPTPLSPSDPPFRKKVIFHTPLRVW